MKMLSPKSQRARGCPRLSLQLCNARQEPWLFPGSPSPTGDPELCWDCRGSRNNHRGSRKGSRKGSSHPKTVIIGWCPRQSINQNSWMSPTLRNCYWAFLPLVYGWWFQPRCRFTPQTVCTKAAAACNSSWQLSQPTRSIIFHGGELSVLQGATGLEEGGLSAKSVETQNFLVCVTQI